MKKYIQIIMMFFLVAGILHAEEYKGKAAKNSKESKEIKAAGCSPGAQFWYLDVNNVRTRINSGGDMFWDFELGKYEIPNGSGKTSIFSASLWLGGRDDANVLRLAANKFRQGPDLNGGTDFFTGPLTIDQTAYISAEECSKWDEMFFVTRNEVEEFIAYNEDPAAFPGYTIPKSILDYPAHGDVGLQQSYYLAPFVDVNEDGEYNPEGDGDYPDYCIGDTTCHSEDPPRTIAEGEPGMTPDQWTSYVNLLGSIRKDQCLKGDETIWWIFNDNGNAHTESLGEPIGLEIRAQAFGFETNDEINNMTFYTYEIVNRSTFRLNNTYFCQWVDTDLGYAADDYVGCDVLRGLAYTYNGDPIDGTGQPFAYGGPNPPPPAVGVDYFQGPYIDPDGIDNRGFDPDNPDCNFDFNLPAGNPDDGSAINGVNFGDGFADNERFGMRAFVYHNNSNDPRGDPKSAIEFYNLMQAKWRGGEEMWYGGNGYPDTIESGTAYGPRCFFMFPGNTDPCLWGTKGLQPNGPINWIEQTAENGEPTPPADRRMMQSAGPFTLTAGAVNYITVGIPWARATSGGPFESVKKLKVADDLAQDLFNNCFKIIQGPDAPDLSIRELDQKLIVYITNKPTSNNYKELYQEEDFRIKVSSSIMEQFDSLGIAFDNTYDFEGYQIFQMRSQTDRDVNDPDKARLVFVADLKNNVTKLINHVYSSDLETTVPSLKVTGTDNGIAHSFTLTTDAFTGKPLVNHRPYFYLALAYAHNEFMKYTTKPEEEQIPYQSIYGQKLPYLASTKNIRQYTAIPHKIVAYTKANADYGDELPVTRIQGQGNGGRELRLTKETIDQILSKAPVSEENQLGDDNYPIAYRASYEAGYSPVSVKVIDPLNVSEAGYKIVFDTLKNLLLNNVSGTPGVEGDTTTIQTAKYKLIDLNTNELYEGDKPIHISNEQIYLELGISLEIKQVFDPGIIKVGTYQEGEEPDDVVDVYKVLSDNNGYLSSSIEFDNPENVWLTGIPDIDVLGPFNWVRSGESFEDLSISEDLDNNDFAVWFQSPGKNGFARDPGEDYESINLNGLVWSPYSLAAAYNQNANGPAYVNKNSKNLVPFAKYLSQIKYLQSVEIRITSDKSKWTRCPVIDLNPHSDKYFKTKDSPSLNIDGLANVESGDPMQNSAYISDSGMSWFPGYAISLETGERLNIAFGEDSSFPEQNGDDMKWNPTSTVFNEYTEEGNPVFDIHDTLPFGGRHYIYIFGHRKISGRVMIFDYEYYSPAYDAGAAIKENVDKGQINDIVPETITSFRHLVYGTAMWVCMPILQEEQEFMSSDVTMRINVSKPYQSYFSYPIDTLENPNLELGNAFAPVYEFSTTGYATEFDDVVKAETDLKWVNVVPNPYFGYNDYEVNQVDNRARITNLPPRTFVTIYNLSGTIVRKFDVDKEGITNILRTHVSSKEAMTSIDWDMKNEAGIPIASGVYLIHVDAGSLGSRVIKWFCVRRETDLNAF